jgi:hypothetical protein
MDKTKPICKLCYTVIDIDTEYMLSTYGRFWEEMPVEEWTWYCPNCEATGTFEQIALPKPIWNGWAEDIIEFVLAYGSIDGAHHKMWVIDQVLRRLCKDEKEYNARIGELIQSGYGWDAGTPP